MAMRQACDVYGTTKGVKTYSLQLKCDGDSTITESMTADLGERALVRLIKKMRAGIKPPPATIGKKE